MGGGGHKKDFYKYYEQQNGDLCYSTQNKGNGIPKKIETKYEFKRECKTRYYTQKPQLGKNYWGGGGAWSATILFVVNRHDELLYNLVAGMFPWKLHSSDWLATFQRLIQDSEPLVSVISVHNNKL